MADVINSEGLTVTTYNELVSDLQNKMTGIYAQDGDSVNFGSETADGQLINILAQLGTDMREIITEVYNSFDPDKCTGSVQDSRYALNYITRKGGTFSEIYIDVTCDRTVELQGLDANFSNPNASSYAVGDNAGSIWYLRSSVTLTAGTHSLLFRSQNIGRFTPEVGTITNQITKVLGVTAVNNPSTSVIIGEQQESDAEFRVRRNRSTAINGQNNEDALEANQLNIDTVVDAKVWVNNTSTIDSTGTNPYTIWAIVEGGADNDIAEVLYQYGGGLDTRGSVTVNWISISQQTIPVKFDRLIETPLYIKFNLKLVNITLPEINVDNIKEDLTNAVNDNISLGSDVETSSITSYAQNAITENGGNAYALDVQISNDNVTYTDYIACPSFQHKFVTNSTRITISAV